MSHSKDVRLRDERELRHTQQMSLLAHKDVLSTLPPEAAARLVNANYTLCMYPQFSSYSSEFYVIVCRNTWLAFVSVFFVTY